MSFVKKSPNYLSSRAQNFKGELWDLFIIVIRIGKDVFDKLFDSQNGVLINTFIPFIMRMQFT